MHRICFKCPFSHDSITRLNVLYDDTSDLFSLPREISSSCCRANQRWAVIAMENTKRHGNKHVLISGFGFADLATDVTCPDLEMTGSGDIKLPKGM